LYFSYIHLSFHFRRHCFINCDKMEYCHVCFVWFLKHLNLRDPSNCFLCDHRNWLFF